MAREQMTHADRVWDAAKAAMQGLISGVNMPELLNGYSLEFRAVQLAEALVAEFEARYPAAVETEPEATGIDFGDRVVWSDNYCPSCGREIDHCECGRFPKSE